MERKNKVGGQVKCLNREDYEFLVLGFRFSRLTLHQPSSVGPQRIPAQQFITRSEVRQQTCLSSYRAPSSLSEPSQTAPPTDRLHERKISTGLR